MIIAVPKEIFPGENRVALVPDTASKLIKKGFQINVEKGAGLNAGFTDDQYVAAGTKLYDNVSELYSSADIVLKVQRPVENPQTGKHEIELMKEGTLLITFMYSLHYPEVAKQCADKGINVKDISSVITPSCGLGTLDESMAGKIIELTSSVSRSMRKG